MKLDPKGLEAAREQIGTNHDGIIRAYLTAITPAEVGGLVERLREGTFGSDITKTDAYLNGLMREAATALEAQAAELAEVQAERDAAREYAMQARLREARLRENAAERARQATEVRTALAEARKALGMMLKEHDILSGNFGDVMDPKHKRPDRWPTAAEAARRALAGGKNDG